VDPAQLLGAMYEQVSPLLDERQRRLLAAAAARALGRGGITVVARATGLSRQTV
jgi:DNA-binding phage protein